MKGKKYAELSLNFLKITQLTLEENIKRGNLNSFTATNLSDEEFIRQSDEAMKYNDNNIGVALLFNFYHGIELLLKTIYKINNISRKNNHGLLGLYSGIKNYIDSDIQKIIESYLLINKNNSIELLNGFFIENNSNVDKFYILLKYPEGDLEFDYKSITWKQDEILPLYTIMKDNIEKLIIYIVDYTKKNP